MKRWLAAGAALFLAGCDSERVTGGGSDQPNKVEAGRILTDSGKPASGVLVESWAGAWNPLYSRLAARLVDSGTTDIDGAWKLNVPDTGDWFVLGRNSNSVAVIPKGQKEGKLQVSSIFRGTVHVGSGLQLEALWLGGVAGAIPVDANGRFSIATQPGPKRLWARVKWPGGFDTILVEDKWLVAGDNVETGLAVDTGLTLLASGESSPAHSSLRGVDFPAADTQDGAWFSTSDHAVYGYGSSSVSPSTFPANEAGLVTEANSGRFYSWGLSLGAPISIQGGGALAPWVGVGFRLSRRDLDWTGVRNLSIQVRGTGSIWVVVDAARATNSSTSQFGRLVNLPGPSWAVVEIPLDSLHPLDSLGRLGGAVWSEARSNVRNLSFFASSSNVRLELKEVQAEGSRIHNW